MKFIVGWILSVAILFMAHAGSILSVGTKDFGKKSPGKIRIAHEIHDFDVSKEEKEKHRTEHQREKLSNGYRDNRNFSLGNIIGVAGTVILIGVVAALLFRVKF